MECSEASYYTGICYNLKQRILDHNTGRYKYAYTKGKLPVKLVYWERFSNRYDSAKKEKVIKGWSRVKKKRLVDSLRRTLNEVKCETGSSSVG